MGIDKPRTIMLSSQNQCKSFEYMTIIAICQPCPGSQGQPCLERPACGHVWTQWQKQATISGFTGVTLKLKEISRIHLEPRWSVVPWAPTLSLSSLILLGVCYYVLLYLSRLCSTVTFNWKQFLLLPIVQCRIF